MIPKITRAVAAKALLSLVAGIAGAWFAWGFGAQLGGALMGFVAACNGAVISALLAGAALDRVLPGKRDDD